MVMVRTIRSRVGPVLPGGVMLGRLIRDGPTPGRCAFSLR